MPKVHKSTMSSTRLSAANEQPATLHHLGMDLIGPLPTTRKGCKHDIVVIDYFTKWAKAKDLAQISTVKVEKFVWSNIIYRFEVSQQIVVDNETQFTSEQFIQFCNLLGIRKGFTAVDHPKPMVKSKLSIK